MKMMKRFVALVLMAMLCFCMVGCGEKDAFYGEWAYNHEPTVTTLTFKSGSVNYKGKNYKYTDDGNGVLALTSSDESFNLRYKFDEDTLYIYEHMTYYYQGEGEPDGLVGYWLSENGRSDYEFTTEGSFREDGYIPGKYVVSDDGTYIFCVYNDMYADTRVYFTIVGNELRVEYPWAMVKTQK